MAKEIKLAEATIDAGGKPNVREVGNSGTSITSGLYHEEFLMDLTGTKAAQVYDKMRRRESQVSMLLDAIINPILAANWDFEIDDENDAEQVKMKALCDWNFREGLIDGLKQHLREALTLVTFGHSVFEMVHATENVEALDGELVTFYKKFAFRKQTSIYRWLLEKKTGKLVGIEQQINTNDLSDETLITIPGDFLIVFTNKKEGDNYEGISALRSMYGAYSRKDLYLKLTAMGIEKNAVGTIIGTTPAGKVNTDEDANFSAVLESYAANEVGYIKVPTGWGVTIQQGQFDPQKMVTILNFENEEMARAVVAGFLMLGAGGGGGSYSLGTDLSDFFLGGIQAYADIVCEMHNRRSIPKLCQLNYGPQAKYPKLKCSGINDKAGKELADIIVALIGQQALTADSKLEEFLRKQYKLPKQDESTARAKPVVSPFGAPPSGGGTPPVEDPEDPPADPAEDPVPPDAPVKKKLSDREVKLAEGYKAQFNKSKNAYSEAMSAGLKPMVADLKKKLKRNWNALSDTNKLKAAKNVEISTTAINAYKAMLRELSANTANDAIARARAEAPEAAKKVKFAAYEKLNPLVKKAIETQIALVAETQAADLTKLVLFQFTSSASSVTDIDQIMNDIDGRVDPVLEGTSNAGMNLEVAAGDLTASVTQNSRNAFFFAPEVLATIESFTFTNEDPVSEICQNLNGQTFLSTDPNAEQFYPPLHHNCKSRIVPNGPGEKEVTGIAINAEDTEERARLAKQITFCDHSHH